MTLHANVRQQLLAQLAADPSPGHEQAQLNNALRLLAEWRVRSSRTPCYSRTCRRP